MSTEITTNGTLVNNNRFACALCNLQLLAEDSTLNFGGRKIIMIV